MKVNLKVEGVDAVRDILANLPPAMQKKVIRPSIKASMKIVKKAAENNLESVTSGESTGTLKKSLRIYNLKTVRGRFRVALMVKRGLVYPGRTYKGKPLRVGMVAGILEYGKKDQPPRSWIRKAARESVNAVYNDLREQINKRITKAINAAKSGAK